MIKLKWKGTGFLFGVPARDLTAKEVDDYGGEEKLLATGLYEKVEDKKETENKRQMPKYENK